MKVKVSVIVPSLHCALYIRECLQSIQNQTFKDIEVLCVDAKSTDGTLEIIQEFVEQDSRFKLIISEKRSYGYQMNLGLEAARAEYVGIVESDDCIKNNMYERLYEVAKTHNVDIVKSDVLKFHTQNNQKNLTYCPLAYDSALYGKKLLFESAEPLCCENPKLLSKEHILKNTWNMNQPSLFSLAFLRKQGLKFNESAGASYQDTGFWFQSIVLCKSLLFVNEAFYLYRQDNENSSCNAKNKVYCLCEEYDFMRLFLEERGLVKEFGSVLEYLRFGGYNWNLNRIADEFKLEFLERFRKDFSRFSKEELDDLRLETWKREILDAILHSPSDFYFNVLCKPVGAVERVQNHLAFKLGMALLEAKTLSKALRLFYTLYTITKKHRFEQKVLQVLYKKMPHLKPLSLELYRDYSRALAVKKYLSYRLGEALVKNPLSFAFKIYPIYKSYKKERK
ncbi:glycosyltransferase family 2 protein [Campylobacter sp. MIT 21-1685]|uniref:glycosyltransferase family 2 protein n=1 Tax=unclassified Campylobacter TaxID=2593542 RepID=UPI00224A8821|nr:MULTISPECIES: glycosyltransferase family 2 protein [unclassified Campylobacter]MCX2683304.1 glycosyltransferase family 2 protein [Campylobacter sp. MIT 21-1684]MCX2751640.1 glycosyltransferase family 2 protein [Campylobacter sp. MIT 21-1682]MCX2807840.1 glycosyltransferase family 2 protein [Campylobacter sp. MIT 21-1685]